jgi:hypothetical protein
VVARDGASCWGQRGVVVDADHVLVADLGIGCCAALCCQLWKTAVGLPARGGRANARVALGRGLAAGPLCLAQCCRYANGSAGLVDALVPLQRQLCGAGRRGRDVHGGVDCRAVGRVLHRLAVGVVLVGRVLRDGSRSGELGCHGGLVVEDDYGRRGSRDVLYVSQGVVGLIREQR